MRRERHGPVNRSEGHRKDIKDNTRPGKKLDTGAEFAVFLVYVLLRGKGVKEQRESDPDNEIERGAAKNTALRQPPSLH